MELGRGTAQEVLERTRRYVSTVLQATALYRRKPDSVESADLRHGNGYALRLRGVTTVSAEAVKEAAKPPPTKRTH
jgi:cell division protein FtsQ